VVTLSGANFEKQKATLDHLFEQYQIARGRPVRSIMDVRERVDHALAHIQEVRRLRRRRKPSR